MNKIFIVTLFVFNVLSLCADRVNINVPLIDNNKPIIDGIESPGEWDDAYLHQDFYQTSPGDNAEPSEKTEVLVKQDKENIYFLCRGYSSDPAIIRDFHCSRDAIYTTDRIFIYLDTFNQEEKAYYFGCNINGEQADGIAMNNIDPSIDFFYYSAGSISDFGYVLEFQLPLTSIKFKSGKDVKWGFFVNRHIPERDEQIAAFHVDRNTNHFFNNYGYLTFSYLPNQVNLKIIPAVVASHWEFEDKLSNKEEDEDTLEGELNIFFEPSSNLTTTITVNPDFNTIEADQLKITLNERYSVYYQEKRPFFIEGSNPYQVDINIFHTRQIINPLWGAKLSGNFGKYSVYTLFALDENQSGYRFGYDTDKEKEIPFGFWNLSRNFRKGNSIFRLAGTIRQYDNAENYVFSLDTDQRITDDIELSAQVVYSLNNEKLDVSNLEPGFGYKAELEYSTDKFYGNLHFKSLDEHFRADLGYIPDVNKQQISNRIEYHRYADSDEEKIHYMEFGSSQSVKYDFSMENMLEYNISPMMGFNFAFDLGVWTGYEYLKIEENDTFEISSNWLSINYDPIRQFSLNLNLVIGKGVAWFLLEPKDSDMNEINTTVKIKPNSFIDFELNTSYHDLAKYYIARSVEAKCKFQFHKNFWMRIITQYQNTDVLPENEKIECFDIYPLFTYKPSSDIALYLGASDSKMQTSESRDYINFDVRAVTYYFKLSYLFDLF